MELLTTAEMSEADRLTIAGGVPGIELMENAGRAVADCVMARHAPGSSIAVVAGPGNNGGDGFVAARILAERGYQVRLILNGNTDRLKGEAALMARRWSGGVEPADPERLTGADAIVDALFGAGLDRPVEGTPRALIGAINAASARVYAVDLPSGINGTSGAVMGLAVRAAETITFFRRKSGHVLLPGRIYCGRVTLADIGIPASVLSQIRPKTFVNEPSLWTLPVPRIDGHKYSRGHAVVVSGGLASTGAARLAARAALRAGAGLVTIASPREALAVNAATNLAVMVRPVDGENELAEFLADARRNVVALGPGGGIGAEMRGLVRAALAGERAVVLDADALTSFVDEPQALVAALLAPRAGASVMTPHEGEFGRVFGGLEPIFQAKSKLDRARLAAAATSAVVVLKGPDTVVAAPDGTAAIGENAPPWLATAGAGDVLTGMIAGLLAQQMPAFEAAAAAVWLHGEVGSEAGPGLIAEDLPETLPRIYARLFAGGR
jgi:ADP-dependent NAD(P)H-hydrate dehydratase / NAD(P)H-hydrate epimerase